MAHFTLTATIRESRGKEAARQLRRNDQIPAIFYGPETDPVMLAVKHSELKKVIKKSTSDNIILDLEIDFKGKRDKKTVVLKELQVEPRSSNYLHADFHEISMDKELTIDVPIRLVGTAKGVSTGGGIMQHVRREMTISCLPGNLIDALEVDVSHLDIGESVHIRDIAFPEGIRPAMEDSLTVAVVAAPTVSVEAAEEEEEPTEAALETETSNDE